MNTLVFNPIVMASAAASVLGAMMCLSLYVVKCAIDKRDAMHEQQHDALYDKCTKLKQKVNTMAKEMSLMRLEADEHRVEAERAEAEELEAATTPTPKSEWVTELTSESTELSEPTSTSKPNVTLQEIAARFNVREKSLRAKLRQMNLDWHEKHAGWVVKRNSKEEAIIIHAAQTL